MPSGFPGLTRRLRAAGVGGPLHRVHPAHSRRRAGCTRPARTWPRPRAAARTLVFLTKQSARLPLASPEASDTKAALSCATHGLSQAWESQPWGLRHPPRGPLDQPRAPGLGGGEMTWHPTLGLVRAGHHAALCRPSKWPVGTSPRLLGKVPPGLSGTPRPGGLPPKLDSTRQKTGLTPDTGGRAPGRDEKAPGCPWLRRRLRRAREGSVALRTSLWIPRLFLCRPQC